MAGYTEWAPSAALAGVLACVWSRTTDPGPARSLRIVPDGCLDLIWSGDRLWVAGPDTRAWVEETEPGTMVGVRFAPGVAPAVLGLPASELRDDRPALVDLWRRPDHGRVPGRHVVQHDLRRRSPLPDGLQPR